MAAAKPTETSTETSVSSELTCAFVSLCVSPISTPAVFIFHLRTAKAAQLTLCLQPNCTNGLDFPANRVMLSGTGVERQIYKQATTINKGTIGTTNMERDIAALCDITKGSAYFGTYAGVNESHESM